MRRQTNTVARVGGHRSSGWSCWSTRAPSITSAILEHPRVQIARKRWLAQWVALPRSQQRQDKNQGELHLSCRSSDGIPCKLGMQGAGVSRPILSVIRLTESGKEGIFKKNGGIIRDTQSGAAISFRRKHGIYVMGIWVKTGPDSAGNPASGIARQT